MYNCAFDDAPLRAQAMQNRFKALLAHGDKRTRLLGMSIKFALQFADETSNESKDKGRFF